ncbi:metal-dependent phosphohydrolase [Brazilian marseillevirus]|uniref:metal-dependent phosphohydrolase n=1 Tax=Brazilian marseillevirus TaxID=1813599 RepID=UPI00078281F4|nr:metal-dependent phosphohydrolase [Brazilian marseillevirus]AMQ10629.1 metal-dependent phosphohydrolase [Brazilian marseillevirus]
MALLQACKETSFEIMSRQDVSHDWHHIKRVVRWAKEIMESLPQGTFDRELVLCGCYLHDVADHKYTGEKDLDKVLWRLPKDYEKMNKLKEIIQRTSWTVQLQEENKEVFIELRIVRDADRLDAFGRHGILRAFATSAKRGTPLVLPTTPELSEFLKNPQNFTEEDGSLIGHFYAKLLRIPEKLYFDVSKDEASKMLMEMHRFILEAFE